MYFLDKNNKICYEAFFDEDEFCEAGGRSENWNDFLEWVEDDNLEVTELLQKNNFNFSSKNIEKEVYYLYIETIQLSDELYGKLVKQR